MAEQYDHIGDKYEQFKNTAPLPIPEQHTFLQLLGELRGQRVLDLACGAGHYSRLLKQRGAAEVLGVDISPEMVAVARRREQENPLGVRYQVSDATHLPELGTFDVVTAVYLLNYARTREDLLSMCQSVHRNLADGGRFLAFTIDPSFDLHKSSWVKYGLDVTSERFEAGRHVVQAVFLTQPPAPFEYLRWPAATYEQVMAEAGFKDVRWHPFEVPAEALARFGADFWKDYQDNPLLVVLSGRK